MEKVRVHDRDLLPLIAQAAEGQDPRTWHWALMDYGSYLKKLHKNPSRLSAHYIKQSKFEGSLRQLRGAILRELHTCPKSHVLLETAVLRNLGVELPSGRIGLGKFDKALAGLERDEMIKKEKGKWRIA